LYLETGTEKCRALHTKFQPERIIREFGLGVALAGIETRVVMGLMIAFA
jgi:hypothetical protein